MKTSLVPEGCLSKGGTLDFKWQGWSKVLAGFEIFEFGIFFGLENFGRYFLGSLIQVGISAGIQNNLKIRDSSHVSRPRSSANKFLWSEIQHGIFEGWNFGSGISGSRRDFFGFWFLPPFDHPYHLKSWVPSYPPPPTSPRLYVQQWQCYRFFFFFAYSMTEGDQIKTWRFSKWYTRGK